MCIKRDRFLGKFKKGPPHIGEYDKKSDILQEANRSAVKDKQHPGSCLNAT